MQKDPNPFVGFYLNYGEIAKLKTQNWSDVCTTIFEEGSENDSEKKKKQRSEEPESSLIPLGNINKMK